MSLSSLARGATALKLAAAMAAALSIAACSSTPDQLADGSGGAGGAGGRGGFGAGGAGTAGVVRDVGVNGGRAGCTGAGVLGPTAPPGGAGSRIGCDRWVCMGEGARWPAWVSGT